MSKFLLYFRWELLKLFRPLGGLEAYFLKLKSIMPWEYTKSRGFIKYYIHPYGVNNLYGHLYSLSKYYNLSSLKTELIVQHGIFLQGTEKNASLNGVDFYISMNHSDMITSGNVYSSKQLLSIGPYILYSEDLLDLESYKKVKSDFGKTLLVVLPHTDGITSKKSIKVKDIIYSNDAVGHYLSDFNHGYDTVLVLDFFKDFSPQKREYFNSLGYKYCLAGNSFDPFFLSRLKLLIELSDKAICFTFGSHIGYFYALNKNIEVKNLYGDSLDYSNSSYILNLTVNISLKDTQCNSISELNLFLNSIMTDHKINSEFVVRELNLLKVFKSSVSDILTTRDDLLESLWGLSKFNKIDLFKILSK